MTAGMDIDWSIGSKSLGIVLCYLAKPLGDEKVQKVEVQKVW